VISTSAGIFGTPILSRSIASAQQRTARAPAGRVASTTMPAFARAAIAVFDNGSAGARITPPPLTRATCAGRA
jgi:hypothetical protein